MKMAEAILCQWRNVSRGWLAGYGYVVAISG